MTSAPVNAADLPPYTFRQLRRRYQRRAPAVVIFDRECDVEIGDHYHRECLGCGARWLERCARSRCS